MLIFFGPCFSVCSLLPCFTARQLAVTPLLLHPGPGAHCSAGSNVRLFRVKSSIAHLCRLQSFTGFTLTITVKRNRIRFSRLKPFSVSNVRPLPARASFLFRFPVSTRLSELNPFGRRIVLECRCQIPLYRLALHPAVCRFRYVLAQRGGFSTR